MQKCIAKKAHVAALLERQQAALLARQQQASNEKKLAGQDVETVDNGKKEQKSLVL